MLGLLLFIWIILFPVPTIAQDDTPTPTDTITETPTPTLSPTPATTEAPTSIPTSTPQPTTPPNSSSSNNSPTTPTAKPTIKQTRSSQSGGFGGDGLVEEKDQPDTGIGFAKDEVLGTNTQEENTAGDKDLLSTLIFLTGAIVLIVWTIYMILVQKGIIKSSMKRDSHRGGITPQPLQ